MRLDFVHRVTFELQIQVQLFVCLSKQSETVLVFVKLLTHRVTFELQVYGQQGESDKCRDSAVGHSPADLLNAEIQNRSCSNSHNVLCSDG